MKSGFTKKTGKKEAPVLYQKQQGVAQAPNGHYVVSTGCPSLDNIFCSETNSDPSSRLP